MMKRLLVLILSVGSIYTCCAQTHELYNLNTQLASLSISFENASGEIGSGGKAVNGQLGPEGKGEPFRGIQPGETVVLCDIQQAGILEATFQYHGCNLNYKSGKTLEVENKESFKVAVFTYVT